MRVELKYQGDKQRMSEKNILEEIAEKTNKEIEPNNNSNKINPIVSTFFLYRFLLNTPILFIIVV